MSCVFMFTACPFDVHTKTTWGPQQPIPVANMTVGLAATPRLRLHTASIPTLSYRARYHLLPILYLHGIPNFPLPNPPSYMPKHIWHPRTEPAIAASQSYYDANGFGNHSTS